LSIFVFFIIFSSAPFLFIFYPLNQNLAPKMKVAAAMMMLGSASAFHSNMNPVNLDIIKEDYIFTVALSANRVDDQESAALDRQYFNDANVDLDKGTRIAATMDVTVIQRDNIPVGIAVGGVQSTNDGDVAIYSILLQKLKQIQPQHLIVDVGAYEGAFSLVSRAVCGNVIHAFEPNKRTYFRLVDYLKKRSVHGVYVYPLAISTQDKEVFLEEAGGSSNIRGSAEAQMLPQSSLCICKPLTDIIETDRHIFFMKIDTEGCDLDVLESSKPFLEKGAIDNIIFEYSAFWLGKTAEEAVAASMPMLTYLSEKYKYMYSLSRRGHPYLVGPMVQADLQSFVIDHYDRHLMTDIYVSNEPVDFLQTMPYMAGVYYA
jgi:FkbM family methyltransferase